MDALKSPLYMQMPFSVNDEGFAYISPRIMEGYSAKGGVNFGDFLVCDATLRLLNYDFSENVQFNVWQKEKAELERLKELYDCIIIRGSTYLWEGYDLGGAADFIEFMDKPVLIFGLGAQAPSFKNIELEKGTIRFLKVISERAVSIGVRGQFTAEQIERHGINNVQVLGCPTFMRKHDVPTIKHGDELERIGITLTRQAKGIYGNNEEHIRLVHNQLLENAARLSNQSFLISQGEKEEYLISQREEGADQAVDDILKYLHFDQNDKRTKPVRDLYLKRTVAFSNMKDWEAFSKSLDFILGFRLHGNIVALHQGVPAVFITCDSRVQEIVDFWNLPYVKSSQIVDIDIEALYQSIDYTGFPLRFSQIKNDWIDFLNKNGAKHSLGKRKSVKKAKGTDQNLSGLCMGNNTQVILDKLESTLTDLQSLHNENYRLKAKLVQERKTREA